jgi:hypothetical protein
MSVASRLVVKVDGDVLSNSDELLKVEVRSGLSWGADLGFGDMDRLSVLRRIGSDDADTPVLHWLSDIRFRFSRRRWRFFADFDNFFPTSGRSQESSSNFRTLLSSSSFCFLLYSPKLNGGSLLIGAEVQNPSTAQCLLHSS